MIQYTFHLFNDTTINRNQNIAIKSAGLIGCPAGWSTGQATENRDTKNSLYYTLNWKRVSRVLESDDADHYVGE